MKEALSFCLFTSILALGAPSAYAKSHAHKKKPSALSVAKPAAPRLSVTAKADAPPPEVMKRPKASYWLAADPHVPLATVDGKTIHSVGKRGKECGSSLRWANPGSRWHAVDAFGQTTGLFEVKGSELYDVTGCHEVAFSPRSGKSGVGLFVSHDSGYTPAEPVGYAPGAPERRRFERLLGVMESSWVNQKPLGKQVTQEKRTLFFHFAPPKDASWENRVDGAGKPIERPRRWAVAGGPILLVAYLGDKGRWHASTVRAPLGLADSYTPVAVFDMNGDGIPEIVVRESDGASFAEKVLRLSPETMTWEEAAESPGGGTV
jgi:hypothetical protein